MKTLVLVESILQKTTNANEEITFTKEEVELLLASIDCLDKQCALTLPCLPLVRKIQQYQ